MAPIRLLPGADAGTRRFHYLSHAVSKAYRERHMPHQVVVQPGAGGDGLPTLTYSKFPLDARMGYHPCLCSRRRRVKSDLDSFGPGVGLYFKYLKFAAILFSVLSLLAIPALVLFSSGDAVAASASGSGTGAASYVSSLALLSLGNLGDVTTVHGDGYERGAPNVTLACPAGMRILRVEAFYGNLSGSVSCPAGQLPNSTESGVLKCPDSFKHLSVNRRVSLPSDSRFEAGACCAGALAAGREDFSALDIRVAGAGCEAQRSRVAAIASGVCLGQPNCTLFTARAAAHSWTPSFEFSTACPGQMLSSRRPCVESWEGAAPDAGLRGCRNHTSGGGARLVVVAKCFTETIGPAWWLGRSPKLSKQSVALIVVACEVLIALTFLAAWALLTQREGQSVASSAQITVADYTLMLTRLPPHDNIRRLEADLRAHLEATLTAAAPVARSDLPRIAIADINFALNDTDVVTLFTARGALLHQIERLSKVALLAERAMTLPPPRSGHPAGAPPRIDKVGHDRFRRHVQLIRLLRTKLDLLDAKIDAAEARIAASSTALGASTGGERAYCCGRSRERAPVMAVAAFVTFEEEEGVLRARATYPESFWGWLSQRRELRLAGRHRLRMSRAPEPSDVQWDNFSLGVCQHVSRRATTALVLLGVLLASAYGIFSADAARRVAAKAYPDVNCVATFGDTVGNRTLLLSSSNTTALAATGRLGCYCKNLLVTQGVSAITAELNLFDFGGGSAATGLCATWLQNYVSVNALIYSVSLAVLVFNIAMRLIIQALVAFERHTTQSSELRVRASYLLFVQFVNTGVLVTLLNAYIDTDFELLRGGEYWDFSPGWYAAVGTSLTLTMLLQVGTIHLSPLLFFVYKSMTRCWDRRLGCDRAVTRVKTQSELNELYMGIDFALDERYAQLYTTTFVVLTYSTGLPLLLPVLALTFALTYAVDKFLFLRHYNTPPYFDERLGRSLTALLPLALLAHLGFGIWQLSSSDVFPAISSFAKDVREALDTSSTDAVSRVIANGLNTPELNIGERFTTWHVIPLSILFALLLQLLLWQHVLVALLQRFSSVFCCCAASAIERCLRSEPKIEGLPNYFMAVPPDVIDEVTSGARRVKPHLAKRLAETRAAHLAVAEKATLASLMASYERLKGVLAALRALRVDVGAQAEDFVDDVVEAVRDDERQSDEEGPDCRRDSRRSAGRRSDGSSSTASPQSRVLASQGSARSLVLQGDSISAPSARAEAAGASAAPLAADNSAALASALRQYARNASTRMGLPHRRRASAPAPRAPSAVASASLSSEVAHGAEDGSGEVSAAVAVPVREHAAKADAGAEPPAPPSAAASTRPRRASLSVVPVDGHGGADPHFEYANPTHGSAPLPAPVSSGSDNLEVDCRAVVVAVVGGDDEEPCNPVVDAPALATAATRVPADSTTAASVEPAAAALAAVRVGPSSEASSPSPRASTGGRASTSTADGAFQVTPQLLELLRIPLGDAAAGLDVDAGRPDRVAATVGSQHEEDAPVLGDEEAADGEEISVPLSRLLCPSTLTDAQALRERLMGSLTLPPGCHVRITRDEALAHAQHVVGSLDHALAAVEKRGRQLYQNICRGVDRRNLGRSDHAASTFDGAVSFLLRSVTRSSGVAVTNPTASAGAFRPAAPVAASSASERAQKPRRSLLARWSLGSSGGGAGERKGDRGSASAHEVELVDRGLLVGVWCYDMQEGPMLRRRFGLEAAVAPALKRHMASTQQLVASRTVRRLATMATGSLLRPDSRGHLGDAHHPSPAATMRALAGAASEPASAAWGSAVSGASASTPAPEASSSHPSSALMMECLDERALYVGGTLMQPPSRQRFVFPDQRAASARALAARVEQEAKQ